MVLTTPKQIKETDLAALCRQATVSVSGYFYSVDLGPDVHPQHHYVGKDRRCTCGMGADCPAVKAVAEYLRAGGERAPDVPSGYYPVAPQVCPICGAETYYVPDLNSKHRGAGWACVKGSEAHYWLAHGNSLRQAPGRESLDLSAGVRSRWPGAVSRPETRRDHHRVAALAGRL